MRSETINIGIDERLKQVAPSLVLGTISSSVQVCSSNEELWKLVKESVSRTRQKVASEQLSRLLPFHAVRTCYSKLGKKASRHLASGEALVRRALKGQDLYRVNNIVEINNLLSLRSFHPVGSYDLGCISGEAISFRPGLPGEGYESIGKGRVSVENIPVLVDSEGPFGSPTSDSSRTMIKKESSRVLMVVMAFSGEEGLSPTLAEGCGLLGRFAKGEAVVRIFR